MIPTHSSVDDSESPEDHTADREGDRAPANSRRENEPSNERFDELLGALSAPRRRLVVEYVDEHEQATLGDLAEYVSEHEPSDEESVDSLELSLHHAHVPRLVDAGLLAYDGDRHRLRRGDRFDAGALLE